MREQTATAVKELLHVRPETGAQRVALRAGVSVAVPLLVVLLLGHPGWSLYAAFGAFTSLYGAQPRPPLARGDAGERGRGAHRVCRPRSRRGLARATPVAVIVVSELLHRRGGFLSGRR